MKQKKHNCTKNSSFIGFAGAPAIHTLLSMEQRHASLAADGMETMTDTKWTIELDQSDFQGCRGAEKKRAGRNHLLLIANGYVGVRGCLTELFEAKEDSSIHCLGIYDQADHDNPKPGSWKEIVNLPDFMSADITFESERVFLNPDKSNVCEFRIWLDLQHAILHLQYVWKSSTGNRLRVDLSRFCSFHDKNLVFNRVQLASLDADAALEYSPSIAADVYDSHGAHLRDFCMGEHEGGCFFTAKTLQHDYEVAISSSHELSTAAERRITRGEKAISQSFSCRLAKGKPLTVTSRHALFTSRDSVDPLADALSSSSDYDSELGRHIAEMERHWQAANVEIDVDKVYINDHMKKRIERIAEEKVRSELRHGLIPDGEREKRVNEEVQREIHGLESSELYLRYCLYIAIVSVPRDLDYASIPSRSLSSSTYKGAIFWEVDTYAFPFYASVFPAYARNLLLYRFKTLEYALKKASDLGFQGAFYAWESLDTGEEATREFVWEDIHSGRMMRNHFGDRQWHISGDVIYAVWLYYTLTGDWDFIERNGAEMILLTARFVGSLVYYRPSKDRYEILHTCCPDEYHEEVDNNAFTNRILRFVLEKAVELVALMESANPERLREIRLTRRISDDEISFWRQVIEKLYITEPDPRTRVIEQHDGYFKLEDICLDEFRSRIMGDEYPGYPIGPAVHTQIVKQADVVQLLAMFKNEYHPIVRLASFDYYDARTEHGSSDSPNAYAIVAAQVGRIDRAISYFLRSARIDLESTNPSSKANFKLGGVHIASSGATWQIVHYGFAGFQAEKRTISFNPVIPPCWKRLRYSFTHLGQRITVAIDGRAITVSSAQENDLVLTVKVNDARAATLEPSREVRRDYKKMGNHYFTYAKASSAYMK
jgi:trehalose/maltose hydrolase-like predicted phosphorylase